MPRPDTGRHEDDGEADDPADREIHDSGDLSDGPVSYGNDDARDLKHHDGREEDLGMAHAGTTHDGIGRQGDREDESDADGNSRDGNGRFVVLPDDREGDENVDR